MPRSRSVYRLEMISALVADDLEQGFELRRKWLPAHYEMAEVIGKWFWLSFPEAPAKTMCAR